MLCKVRRRMLTVVSPRSIRISCMEPPFTPFRRRGGGCFRAVFRLNVSKSAYTYGDGAKRHQSQPCFTVLAFHHHQECHYLQPLLTRASFCLLASDMESITYCTRNEKIAYALIFMLLLVSISHVCVLYYCCRRQVMEERWS